MSNTFKKALNVRRAAAPVPPPTSLTELLTLADLAERPRGHVDPGDHRRELALRAAVLYVLPTRAMDAPHAAERVPLRGVLDLGACWGVGALV